MHFCYFPALFPNPYKQDKRVNEVICYQRNAENNF